MTGYTGTMALTDSVLTELDAKAEAIRETIIQMLVNAGSGHTAGPLGMADIFTALYFHVLRHENARADLLANQAMDKAQE